MRLRTGDTYLLLLLTILFWGTTPVAGKLAIQQIPPFTVGVLRFGCATVVLAAFLWRYLPDPISLRREDLWLLLWLGLLGSALHHAYFLALIFAPAAHGAVIAPTTSPVWTPLLAARLGHERPTLGQFAGMLLCLIGGVLVVRLERSVTPVGTAVIVGDLLFMLAGLAWPVYSALL